MPEIIYDLTAFSPAKVNLHLAVKEKRPDGFHNLESVFITVDFGDILNFSLKNDTDNDDSSNLTEISMMSGKKSLLIPLNDNIIYKAISLFKEKTGLSYNFKINVKKKIPLGGGLGGGSSNAACALLSLNKMAGCPCSRSELLEMAAVLGSDVPFFIHRTAAAYVTGRGEVIKPLDLPPLFLVLVSPGFSSNTARAFRLLDKYRVENNLIISSDSIFMSSAPNCENFRKKFFNDFLPVFPHQEKSIYNNIINALEESGALYANLSGAGSICFGVYKDEDTARNAAKSFCGADKWSVEFCRSLIL